MTETTAPKKTRKQIAEFGAETKRIAARHMTVPELVAEKLKAKLLVHKYIDVSRGTAKVLGVSDASLAKAIQRLEANGVAARAYVPAERVDGRHVTLILLVLKLTEYGDIVEAVKHNEIYKFPTVDEARQRIVKSATYGLPLEKKLEKIDQADIPETQKRSLKAIAKSEDRADKGKRAWVLKGKGYSNVAIGKSLGVSESTVRVLLKPYAEQSEKIKVILAAGQEALEDAREGILEYVSERPEFSDIFRQGDSTAHILRIHTTERDVRVDPNKKRIEFTLKFWADSISDD